MLARHRVQSLETTRAGALIAMATSGVMCAERYGQCNLSPCCDGLYGCFQRNGRSYRQCRPMLDKEACNNLEATWLCPEQAPASTSAAPLPASNALAARFARSLGPGINVMATNIRLSQVNSIDFEGLANRVGHVRLCGDLLRNMIDWSNCPGRPLSFDNMTESQAQAEVHTRITSDPGFNLFISAARKVLASGKLRLVLNPIHKKWTATLGAAMLRRFWRALLVEFDATRFPTDRVAFEMVNEPGNWQTWHVENRVGDLQMEFVQLVSAAQPDRVVIVPAEMGYLRCGPVGPSRHFIQSWETIISRRIGNGADALRRFELLSLPVIGTFHFYDPRKFTHQQPLEDERWSVQRDSERIRVIFEAIRLALPALPFYVGEFGLHVDIAHPADAVEWLRTVRTFAQERGFAFALWTYFTSMQGVTESQSALGRMRDWDCSELVAAVYNFTIDDRSACGGLLPFSGHEVPDPYSNSSEGNDEPSRRQTQDHYVRSGCNDFRPIDAPEPITFREPQFPPCAPAPPPFTSLPPQLQSPKWPPCSPSFPPQPPPVPPAPQAPPTPPILPLPPSPSPAPPRLPTRRPLAPYQPSNPHSSKTPQMEFMDDGPTISSERWTAAPLLLLGALLVGAWINKCRTQFRKGYLRTGGISRRAIPDLGRIRFRQSKASFAKVPSDSAVAAAPFPVASSEQESDATPRRGSGTVVERYSEGPPEI